MEQYTNNCECKKKIEYIESFRTIKTLHLLDPKLREQILDQGFTFEQVQNFLDTIDIDIAMLCFILNISGFDLLNTFRTGQFNREMCSKILAVAEIYAYGYHVYQNRRLFNNWMKRESFSYHYASPLSFLNSSEGIEDVRRKIRRVAGTSF